MLPRRQRASCTLTLNPCLQGVKWQSCPRQTACALGQSLLASPHGVVRCILAHFAKANRAHSLLTFAEQLHAVLRHPLQVEIRPLSIVLHNSWEVPFSALTKREMQLLLLLIYREGVFEERTAHRLRQFKFNDEFEHLFNYFEAIIAVISFVAVLPCGFLALPLATLLSTTRFVV